MCEGDFAEKINENLNTENVSFEKEELNLSDLLTHDEVTT